MKNRSRIGAVCICILLTAVGCGTGAENEEPFDESMESAAVTESDREEPTESDDHREPTTAATEESAAGNDAEESGGSDSGSAMPGSRDADTESEVLSDESVEPAVITESEREEPAGPYDNYEELIADAKECIEGKAEDESEEYDFSYMIYRFGPYYGASMGLGYLIEDIDGNGTDELIFGQNSEPGTAADGIIYDLYTISDGELVHVFDGGERSTYFLCENGMIAHEGTDSASTFAAAYYTYEGTELHLVEAVLFNDMDHYDDPWFYSTQTVSYYDMENAESISEEQARTIMEKYVYERPTFIPFVEE